MSKTKLSLINSISSVALTLISGLFGIIVTGKLIETYGSDFNGLNSTAAQFISVLLIVEGGFALAANVALFKPLSVHNVSAINSILSAVTAKFKKISMLFLLLGFGASVIFTVAIKSELSVTVKFGTFIMLVISTFVNLITATKYKVLIQSDQREYIINFITITTFCLSYALMYWGILKHWPMLTLRAIILAFAVINSGLIVLVCRKKYSYIDTKAAPDYESIKGTSDVFVQKITGVIYYSAPILALSVFINTAAASVYAVYNSVFALIRNFESAMMNAPRMSIGRLASEEGVTSSHVKEVFDEYEYIVFITISLMLSVAAVMIMPFIKIYSRAFFDISYSNWRMALILIFICFIESIHIPSGNLINMAGHFKIAKKIQLFSCGVLILGLIIGSAFYGIDGILLSILIVAIVLAVLEIGYVQRKIFKKINTVFVRTLLLNVASAVALVLVELRLHLQAENYLVFFAYTIAIALANAAVLALVNYLLNRALTVRVMKRFFGLIQQKH